MNDSMKTIKTQKVIHDIKIEFNQEAEQQKKSQTKKRLRMKNSENKT